MEYKIVGDSCMDLAEDMKGTEVFVNVPLFLHIGEETIRDDETFEQKLFLEKMKESSECPKSSCPAPEDFEKYYSEADEILSLIHI